MFRTIKIIPLEKKPEVLINQQKKVITSIVFQVRNIPAALYKAMGGFATNNVNMIKLESYMLGGSFEATQFFVDIQGHPEDGSVKRALEELQYFTNKLDVIGVYRQSSLETKILDSRILYDFIFKPVDCFVLNLTNSFSTYSMLLAQLFKRERRLFQPSV